MKIGYTEFSYGFAFTENLIRASSSKLKGAPIFPNLLQEASLGYDVKLSLPSCSLFFQFKLPERMVRKTAEHHGILGLSVPFFRFPIMRRDLSGQHNCLLELEKKQRGNVYYVAAEAETLTDFDTSYLAGAVHKQSIYISPLTIGKIIDNEQHYICYQDGLSYAVFCSNPQEIAYRRFGEVNSELQERMTADGAQALDQVVASSHDTVMELVSPQMRSAEGQIRQRVRARLDMIGERPIRSAGELQIAEDILVVQEIARVGLGVEMLIAQFET
ncbi:hypothetical protein [uncultured Rhodoblastus sp.]|uniref:hypothetical protein n=1 Tax=uncultured Rhodoblastus sp. TaxID=543037 RepID=UPI0025FA077C|nr:hypothetical protein [uncultured Rhodoblastus sp.]